MTTCIFAAPVRNVYVCVYVDLLLLFAKNVGVANEI